MPPATPSHSAETPWPRPEKARETGPGPFRTARAAGRLFLEALFFAGLRLAWLPDGRDREVEAPLFEVLLLRDAGGEDVRVDMLRIYAKVTRSRRIPRVTRVGRVRSRSTGGSLEDPRGGQRDRAPELGALAAVQGGPGWS